MREREAALVRVTSSLRSLHADQSEQQIPVVSARVVVDKIGECVAVRTLEEVLDIFQVDLKERWKRINQRLLNYVYQLES